METINKGYKVGTETFLNKRTALERAYKLNLTTVYDLENNSTIELPTKQVTGTYTQQQAYLTSVIDRLCK